jgi:signal transduction histidine kinase
MVSGILTGLLRWTAFATVAVAIYVVVGSKMFPTWWYGLFFEHDTRKFRYIREGSRSLLFLYPRLSIKIIVAFFVAIVVGAILKRWLFPLTDRFAARIILAACVAVVADVVVLYLSEKVPSRRVREGAASLTRAIEAFQKLGSPVAPPRIESLIYFLYLDEARVESLYTQIQPEWVDKERTVEGSSSVQGKVGVGGIGAEAGEKISEKSSSTRSDLSIDKKCVLLMRYVIETWPGNYFSNELYWNKRRCWKDVDDHWKGIYSRVSVDSHRLKGAASAQWQTELKSELESLGGLFVLVDGEFDESVNRESATLTKEFSTDPKSSFRISLPQKAFQALPNTRPLCLRVFGHVTKALGEDGFVDVAAIAAYIVHPC